MTALASLVLLVTLAAAPAAAQYPCYAPPVVSYYAPPAPQPYVGASYSFYPAAPVYAPAPAYAAVQSYYRPYPILRPRLYAPGPTYYTPTYPYTTGYYSYYYTPGYFRY
jgi:hypothetical protein